MKGANLIVFISAGRAKTIVASKGDQFKIAAMRASIHGTTLREITTEEHFVDVINDRGAGAAALNVSFSMQAQNSG